MYFFNTQKGHQHFKVSPRFHSKNALEEGIKADVTKRDLCKANGIALIEIPYWWNRKRDSLEATIYTNRPDLFQSKPRGLPIPTDKPTSSQKIKSSSEGTKIFKNEFSIFSLENMKKKFMLATEWDRDMNPTGWYMTEKYDGVRLLWNGSAFFTRQGKKLKVPENLTRHMPSVTLDGELWYVNNGNNGNA
jgi:ATP-dependent DNA ligase